MMERHENSSLERTLEMKIHHLLRRCLISLVAVCLVLGGAPWVAADDNVVHIDNILHQDVSSFTVPDLVCTGGPGTITTNAQFHIVRFVSGPQAGSLHVTRSQFSSFEFTPATPGAPTFTGSITSATSVNSNSQTVVETLVFDIQCHGSDGSQFAGQIKEHVTVTPDGVTSNFFDFTCH